ncbi:MAG: prepilin-type N-terminal cleavage/methylation domain-containing protein [Pseudomonadota bacterium]
MANEGPRIRGFTLIELLVSMTVLTILGVLAFSVLSQMQQAHQIGRNTVDRFGELQFAFQLIARDVQQMSPRPVREIR